MNSRISKSKRALIVGIMILGIILGATYLMPKDPRMGALIGFVISGLLNFLIFSEFRKLSNKMFDGNNSFGINMKNYYSHPTQIPIIVGATFSLLGLFLLPWIIENIDNRYGGFIILLPFLFSFGLSGYLMIRMNETVGKYGHIHKGFWAYATGVTGVLFGWVGGIIYLLAIIFNW